MSYAVRNTIILLVVFLLFAGAGGCYIYFYQQPKIEQLQKKVKKKRTELKQNQEIANQYPALKKSYEAAVKYLNNYDKALYKSSDEDDVFKFINHNNTGSSYADFIFSFADTTNKGKYGFITMKIAGLGYYRNFFNFIRKIELSKPLNKISDLSISPINQVEEYGKVKFSFTLKSFYDRAQLLGQRNLRLVSDNVASVFNPFFPLIRTTKGNKNNLINIGKSTLLAISTHKVFLKDQNGVMQILRKGDKVYLGKLSSINVRQGSASFILNEGGIIKHVTLRVNSNDENNDQ